MFFGGFLKNTKRWWASHNSVEKGYQKLLVVHVLTVCHERLIIILSAYTEKILDNLTFAYQNVSNRTMC